MFLYQHSPRCSLVLQHFLDNNPEYWCLVPMSCDQARMDDIAAAAAAASSSKGNAVRKTAANVAVRQLPESPTFVAKPMFFEKVMGVNTRSNEESVWLSKSVPKPPNGYRFSGRQIEEQINFFKYMKDTRILPSNLVNFYKYTIVAVCKCHHHHLSCGGLNSYRFYIVY
jgi:hypothetical protein